MGFYPNSNCCICGGEGCAHLSYVVTPDRPYLQIPWPQLTDITAIKAEAYKAGYAQGVIDGAKSL